MSHLTNTELPMSHIPGKHVQQDSREERRIITAMQSLQAMMLWYEQNCRPEHWSQTFVKHAHLNIEIVAEGTLKLWWIGWSDGDMVRLKVGKFDSMSDLYKYLAQEYRRHWGKKNA